MKTCAYMGTPMSVRDTTPERYISFVHALNLRFPDEDTGDWHFRPDLFVSGKVPMAGLGERVNTSPALGALGVRDMAEMLAEHGIGDGSEAIFAADHFRAIADMVAESFSNGVEPNRATPSEINAWLDTEDQIKTLRDKYLAPLASLFDPNLREVFSGWLTKVRYH